VYRHEVRDVALGPHTARGGVVRWAHLSGSVQGDELLERFELTASPGVVEPVLHTVREVEEPLFEVLSR